MGYSVDKRLRPTAEFLKSEVRLQGSDLKRVIMSFPDILSRDVDKILRPNLAFLQRCGFSKGQVMALVAGYPHILIKSVKHCLEPRIKFLVEEMGRDMIQSCNTECGSISIFFCLTFPVNLWTVLLNAVHCLLYYPNFILYNSRTNQPLLEIHRRHFFRLYFFDILINIRI